MPGTEADPVADPVRRDRAMSRACSSSTRDPLPAFFELRAHVAHIDLELVPIDANHIPVHHRGLPAGRRGRNPLAARPLMVS
jgi:hypothetical protein